MTHEEWHDVDADDLALLLADARETLASLGACEDVGGYALRVGGYLGHGCRWAPDGICEEGWR